MKPRPALILWRDAWKNDDSVGKLDKLKAAGNESLIVEDIGFVIDRTKDHVTFVYSISHWEDGDTYKGLHSIPTSMIKKVKYLKEPQ